MKSKLLAVIAASGMLIGTMAVGYAQTTPKQNAPGQRMQDEGPPGASGSAPGQRMQKGSAPGQQKGTTGQGTTGRGGSGTGGGGAGGGMGGGGMGGSGAGSDR